MGRRFAVCTFLAVKWKLAILCACAILCALQDHLSEQNRGFLLILLKIISPEPHLYMGMQVEVLETFANLVFKLAKICRRWKKSPAKFRKKIKITF